MSLIPLGLLVLNDASSQPDRLTVASTKDLQSEGSREETMPIQLWLAEAQLPTPLAQWGSSPHFWAPRERQWEGSSLCQLRARRGLLYYEVATRGSNQTGFDT